MDALDNVIYATLISPLANGNNIGSDYIPVPFAFIPVLTTPAGVFNPVYSFQLPDKEAYISFTDPSLFEASIERHWYDVNWNKNIGANNLYEWNPGPIVLSDFSNSSNYHLIYSYLLENTRILQIFERVIETYLTDEKLGIAPANVYQWKLNSEELFFKASSTRPHNIRSLIRASYDENRRNAYYRMFGIDLSFGDLNSSAGSNLNYKKAEISNQHFIVLFEKYLSEIWQGYINANNTSGVNTTDVNNIVDIATELQELLLARRGGRPGGGINVYAGTNLSKEEFASAILLTWFTYVISYDSHIVNFLNCQSSTIGERLTKIGAKVGIKAHSKSQELFEMAGPAANILILLEIGGYLDNTANVTTMLRSLNPGTVASLDRDYMNNFLVIINNWEKTTGHRIKNPEANIRGTVTVAQQQRTNGKPVLTGV